MREVSEVGKVREVSKVREVHKEKSPAGAPLSKDTRYIYGDKSIPLSKYTVRQQI